MRFRAVHSAILRRRFRALHFRRGECVFFWFTGVAHADTDLLVKKKISPRQKKISEGGMAAKRRKSPQNAEEVDEAGKKAGKADGGVLFASDPASFGR